MIHIVKIVKSKLTVEIEFWIEILVWSLKFEKVFFASLWPVVQHCFIIRNDQNHISFWCFNWWTWWTDFSTWWQCWGSSQSCSFSGGKNFCGSNGFSCGTIGIPWWAGRVEWRQVASVGTVFVTDTISQTTILDIFASFIASIVTIIGITVLDTVDTCEIAIVGAVVRLWIPVDKTITVNGILWTPIVII